MKKSLKNKILIGVPVIFVAVMLIVMVVVLAILSRQNRKVANTLINNTFNIIRYAVSERQEKLLLDSRQMASIDNMGRKIKYITESSTYFKYDTLRPTYMTMAGVIYSTSITANVWKASIYNSDGDLMTFTVVGENESSVGCIHNRETIEIATLKPDEELTRKLWTEQDKLPAGIEHKFGRPIPDEEVIRFEIVDNALCMVTYIPIVGKEYNTTTEKMEGKQVGLVAAAQKLDEAFIKDISKLGGTVVNILTLDTASSGAFAKDKAFDFVSIPDFQSEWTLSSQEIMFSDVEIAEDSYFQGILPIYDDSKCIAVIASLYSKKMAQANTTQIIELLSLVYLVGIILIVPITILVVVRGVINPIAGIASMMREIAIKKDFTKVLKIESKDEIGDLASSFNEMTSNLRQTTTSIDNLKREISERKKAEETLRISKSELHQQNQFLNNVLESLTHPFYVIDANDYTVKMANSAAHVGELRKGSTCHVLIHNSNEPCGGDHICPLEELKRTKKPVTVEHTRYDKDGKLRSYEIHGYPIFDSLGNICEMIEYYFDISERKQAGDRQAHLFKQLEKTNKELKDFAYVISHDLKAPLRGIDTLAKWIMTDYADKLDEAGKHQMALLSCRVDRMHNLIEGVLQYSRVGRIHEEKIYVNLNEVVQEIIDGIAAPENVTITIENELPVIEFEKTRITQVFQNLISNALKYMDKPKGQINIGCVEEDGFWRFSVTDNGPGIEEKYFEKIFQMFQTLLPRDEFESTGIGLTLVKKIIESYGGRIWVESKVGLGSAFYFALPKKEMEIENAELEANIAC